MNAILLHVGRKGAGKTFMLRILARKCRRALIVDPEMTWKVERGDFVVYGARELLEYVQDHELVSPAEPFRIVYRDNDLDAMKVAGPGVAYALQNLTLIVDELAWLCDSRMIPERLRWLPQFGRVRQINLLGTTREPQEIHDLLFSQADLVTFFQVYPGNGLDRIRKRYGRDLAGQLPRLSPRKYVQFGNGNAVQVLGTEGLAR